MKNRKTEEEREAMAQHLSEIIDDDTAEVPGLWTHLTPGERSTVRNLLAGSEVLYEGEDGWDELNVSWNDGASDVHGVSDLHGVIFVRDPKVAYAAIAAAME